MKRGSAIIISVLLLAVVGGVIFAVGRLFYIDSTLGILYEDSTIAYYTAESGIEEGFLRYRYNKNSEISADDELLANRSNIDIKRLIFAGGSISDEISEKDKRIYDLRIFYQAPFYGNDVDGVSGLGFDDIRDADYISGPNKIFYIPRDESIKIDITSAISEISNDTKLTFVFDGDADDSFVEAKIIGTSGGELLEYKKALVTSSTTTGFSKGTVELSFSSSGGVDVYSINNPLSSIAGSAAIFDTNESVELYLRPMKSGVKVAIFDTMSSTFSIASPWTTVKSTGYYGNVARTLQARIDRQSGTVYDLYDYVIFEH